VAAFGKYVTEIVDRKSVQNQNLLVLEGGVHHLLRPALVGEAFPATFLAREQSNAETGSNNPIHTSEKFQVHGPLCTALDQLGSFSLPSQVAPGDSLVFHQCGAYGFTESMPFFLCHELPAEFVIKSGEVICLRSWLKPESWMV